MRMVRYLLESIQQFGGPISRAARCVLSVGADEEPYDLLAKHEWTRNHNIEVSWVDRQLFLDWEYDATGFDRFWIDSDADIVAQIDADLLIAGDFDKAVQAAYQAQTMLGFIAHISPFSVPGFSHIASDEWWSRVYKVAGLPTPSLDWQYTGWGLDWDTILPGANYTSSAPEHKHCPPYFNYGVILGPRSYFEMMGKTYVAELESVHRVTQNPYASQIANCLAFERYDIPCLALPLNYNFPMNLPSEAIRDLNPDPEGENADEDIKIFHYINQRRIFESAETVQAMLGRPDLEGSWRVFQEKLRIISERIGEPI